MITFLLLVTIWIGPEEHNFRVYTTERFYSDVTCSRAANNLAGKISAYADAIRGGRSRVFSECVTLTTRIT